MRKFVPFAFLATLTLGFATLIQSEAAPPDVDVQVTATLKELRVQQTALRENQKKIDEKLAAIAEDIRLAKIFVSRGGKVK